MSTPTCNAYSPLLIDPVNQALLALSGQGALKPGLLKLLARGDQDCRQCGRNLLQQALAHYRAGTVPACGGCAQAHADLISQVPQDREPVLRKLVANLLQGAARFGLQAGITPAAPIIVTWELTTRCNMGGCRHCHIAASGNDCCQEEISLPRARQVAKDMADLGVCAIAFTGGECLLWPGFTELLRYATGLGLHCYLATNGLLLSRERVAELKQAGLRLAHISLDGATAATHDAFRRYPGSFEQVLRAVTNCREEGLQVAFASTPTRVNAGEMTGILRLADDLGVDWVITYNYVPTGRGGLEMDLEAADKERLWRELLEQSRLLGRTRWLSFAPQTAVMERSLGSGGNLRPTHYYEPLLSGAQRMLASSPACMAGRFYLAIKADGRVTPCIFLAQEAGHLNRQGIADIWQDSPVLAALRSGSEVQGACAECAYSQLCGGCRARAKAATGDYLASDPRCPVRERTLLSLPAAARQGLQQERRG